MPAFVRVLAAFPKGLTKIDFKPFFLLLLWLSLTLERKSWPAETKAN